MKNQVKLSMEELQVASFSEVINREEQLELFGGGIWDDILNWIKEIYTTRVVPVMGLSESTSGSNNNNTITGTNYTITWDASSSGTTFTVYSPDSIKIGSYTCGMDSLIVK